MALLLEIAEGRAQPPPDDLVMLGDVFDLILTPLNQTHRPPKELFADTNSYGFDIPKFRKVIEVISQRIEVTYIRGNHDEFIDAQTVQDAFGPCVKFLGDGFSKYGIRFEHGHNPDMLCRVHREKGKKPLLPIGYYVTRSTMNDFDRFCHAPDPHRGNSYLQQMMDYISTRVLPATPKPADAVAIQVLKHNWEKAISSILTGALGKKMPAPEEDLKEYVVNGADAHEVYFGMNTSNYTLYDAVQDHRAQFSRLTREYSFDELRALVHIINYDYNLWAALDTKHDVIILGHTHRPMIREMARSGVHKKNRNDEVRKKVVYVNSGAWVDDNQGVTYRTYVDFQIMKRPSGEWRASRVEVVQYPEVLLYSMDL
eukprot:gnl/MRDRNA2_/MRDRNA2_298166_c0_seq1.p1 gnl/MRDRNA2_/MRDRNA2_298166_c0~~gnl/MRDRNA2_/MRDRNA2_298166_c0_seq1.p1  ORF type:complete len:423 (+),score=70.35 gnl/MRDRNA2_/MRDRNA2_298166_c0_seq1:162-1271(+)